MASSGSFSGSIKDGHYTLRVDWSQTKNVSANTSTITCTMYLVNDWSLSISGRTDNTCTIDGTAHTFSSSAVSTTGTHSFGSVSQTVSHASDGSKSLTISAVFYIRATISGTYYGSITASATITLDSIPRASSVSATSVNMGSATTISISRASSAFTHTLTYAFGSTSGTIATKTTSTSVSWTPPLTLANQIPNAVSGTCTITCTTYNGSTSVGSKTCTLTLTVPSTIKPTISSLTAARVDGEVPSSWGIYVQSKSKAKLTINGASGAYGSTITSYAITGGGYAGTESSLTTGFLNSSGSVIFTATVRDSRGRSSTSASVTISVVSYSPPSFSSYLSQRCTSVGTIDDEGTYIAALISFTHASCNSKNTVTTKIRYKKASATSWTSTSVTFPSSGSTVVFGSGAISTESSYDIEYTITDAFTSVTILDMVSTAAVVMDFKKGGKGVAVGKVAETDNLFDVSEDWDMRVYGQLLSVYVSSQITSQAPTVVKTFLGKITTSASVSTATAASWTNNRRLTLSAGTYLILFGGTITGTGKAVTFKLSGVTYDIRQSVYCADNNTYSASGVNYIVVSSSATVYLQSWSPNLTALSSTYLIAMRIV